MTWAEKPSAFKDPPTGSYVARCISIIDIGTRKSEYKGETTIKRETIIRWELPTELMDDGDFAGKPFTVSKFYTASLGEKANLRRDLVNWRGREFTPEELAGFDERVLLDKCCMVSITKKDTGKVGITALMKLAKGVEQPPRINDLTYFSLEKDRFDRAVFESLSEWMRTQIQQSPEWAEINGKGPRQQGPVDPLDDEVPF